MEIIKQLYDIGSLIDIADNLEIISETFKRFSRAELSYRNRAGLSYYDVIEDIIQTSLCVVSRGAAGSGRFNELQAGIQRVSRFIFSESFHIEKAIPMAAKAAYIASLIKHGSTRIEKYNNYNPGQMKDWIIVHPIWAKLNRLKRSNPEAFFYWYKIHELDRP